MAKPPKTTIDEELVRKMADLLDETGLSEIEYGQDGLTIRVAKNLNVTQVSALPPTDAASPLAAPPSAEASVDAEMAVHPGTIASPMVGVAFTSPDPTSPAFIQVGDEITKGQTLFLIEAMKVFNPILAPHAGRVTRVFIENETPVEYGEPLAIIE
jgi:acetyl-CoA carboxylase biotin carboxyl carrier protein